MSRFKKSSVLIAILTLGLMSSSTQAVIVVDYGAVRPPPPSGLTSRFVPLEEAESAHLIQRSNAWRAYDKNNPRSAARLAYPWTAGSMGTPGSSRQAEVRNNISRAHVYRLR